MFKRVIENKTAIYLITIEIVSFIWVQPKSLDAFFLIWSLLFLAMLVYNIFNVASDTPVGAIGGFNAQTMYANLSSAMCEEMYKTDKTKSRTFKGLYDPLNLVYLILMIVNAVGYIIFMR